MGPFPRGIQSDRLLSVRYNTKNKMFGDVTKDAGLKALDAHLADNSYVEDYVPSQADTAVFDALKGKTPDRSTYPHAERWFLHIKSFEASKKQFPKSSKPADSYLGGSAGEDEDDEDVDLFGSDDEEEDEEAAKIREQRLAAYAEKKSKKPALIAKTSVLLDVKPWDDETDMDALTTAVKSVEMDGLTWGATKYVPVGYGIKKLVVMCTVVDDKVSIEELQEKIEAFEDFVQSCDVAAMNKI